jgi:hypothetical protein
MRRAQGVSVLLPLSSLNLDTIHEWTYIARQTGIKIH